MTPLQLTIMTGAGLVLIYVTVAGYYLVKRLRKHPALKEDGPW
jgi:hypothetical protein